jgi:hypothetical protein
MKKKAIPVARIDLSFDNPAEIIRTAVKSFLPDISGNKEEMLENVELILKEVGIAQLTVACTETDDGISILFMKEQILEVPPGGLIQLI